MNRIKSFTINHNLLMPGFYISREDGDVITYDLRTRKPNAGDYMDNATMHSLEHMFATYIRNSEMGNEVVYFGPMGCRTGFYLILAGDYKSEDIVDLMISMFEFIRHYHDPIPGANPRECGNYQDMNLNMANYLAEKFLKEVLYNIGEDRLNYPEG